MQPLVPFDLGAVFVGPGKCLFRAWAPKPRQAQLRLLGPERLVPLCDAEHGYREAVVEGVEPGQRYQFRLDGRDVPDPASRWQPDGSHGPSAVFDPTFPWSDAGWPGLAAADLVLYEIHVGTFTPAGTFDAAIGELPRLCELGITAVEVMPVSQYPGARNWGYDGTYPWAVQNSYGGPAAFQRFVDACHGHGLGVVLDVVYNHLGPEGNYFHPYGPYFTDRYRNPWGEAINFDGPGSNEVRRYFFANALYWQTAFHLDGLRLDAVDHIKDGTARHFLAELAEVTGEQARRLGRPFTLIAESDQNDARLLRPTEMGGHGLAGQWADDLHHSVHTLLTGERTGYYADFGTLEHLARAYQAGFAYTGQHSGFRNRRQGGPTKGTTASQFVVCVQNHDQVGNRAHGDRLSALTDHEGLKLAAGLLLLSPYVPLIFMGEEHGEPAPFLYFTSHGDRRLAEGVTRGRRAEFAAFAWKGEVPDPQAESTFQRSKVGRPPEQGPRRALYELYRELLRLRRTHPALAPRDNERLDVHVLGQQHCLSARRWAAGAEVWALFHLGGGQVEATCPLPAGKWRKLLASPEPRWGGACNFLPDVLSSNGEVILPMAARSFILYQREGA
jgi:maltooligosyltrehalose trehalohydrolase